MWLDLKKTTKINAPNQIKVFSKRTNATRILAFNELALRKAAGVHDKHKLIII